MGQQRAPSEADASRAPEGGQAAAGPRILAAAALVGWAALAAGGGGIDPGDALGGRGPVAAAWALALGAPGAALALALAARRPALRSGPAALAAGAAAALVALTALSILWAPAPDRAWIAANRAGLGLVALLLGLALAARLQRAPEGLALGLLLAAAPTVAWALGTKVVPGALGEDGALGRLSAPVGYPNALAMVCVVAVPGALWLATRDRRWAPPLAAAVLAALLLTTLLTLSRSGLLALVVAAAVALRGLPRASAAVAAGVAAVAGAAWPAAFALTHPGLTSDGLPAAARAAAGAGLGWRLTLGLSLAAALAPALALASARWARPAARLPGGRAAAAAALSGVAALGIVAALALGGDGGAVDNRSGRLVATGDNGRLDWWGDALAGAADAPLIGNGGGSFELVHLRQRDDGADAFRVREAHQMLLGVLSDLGLAGLALTLALLAGFAWALLRARRRGARRAVWLPAAVLAATLVQAQVDWTWSVPALLTAALAAGGVILAQAADPRAPRSPAPRPLTAVAVAGAACALAASALLPWLSLRALQRGEAALAAGRPDAALEAARAARARNPLALAPLFLEARARSALDQPARALGAYVEMTRRQPENPRAWTLLALALGDGPAARNAWRRVLELNPRDARARAELG